MHNKQKSFNENIIKYNKKKCKWKKYTKKSVFFLFISLVMLIIKKINNPSFNGINFGIFVTSLNLFSSIIFHYEFCPYYYKFYIRCLDIIIANIIFIVALYFGNVYTYIIAIITSIIFIIELNFDDDININEVGILHTLLHMMHPIIMYTIIFINIQNTNY